MDKDTGFDRFIELANREANLLFQRLNYFLIGSAFLVTAFSTLVAVEHFNLTGPNLTLAYMINLTGFYLSLFFSFINYLNTRIIWHKHKFIRDMESITEEKRENIKAFTKSEDILVEEIWNIELKDNYLILLSNMIKESFSFIFRTYKTSKQGLAPHTYWIPLGFTVFWLVVFLLIIPVHWLNTTLFILPFIILLLTSTYKLLKNKTKVRGKN